MNQPQTQHIVVHTIGQSTFGTAGLIFSCLGWLTCGLLCIPGAAMSLLGLFSNKQKSHAIVGLVVGFPGVIFFVVAGAAFILPLIGLGGLAVTGAAAQAARAQAELAQKQSQAQTPVTSETAADVPAELPQEMQPEQVPLEDAQPVAEVQPSEPVSVEPVKMDPPEPIKPDPIPEQPKPEPMPEPEQSRYHTFTDVTGKHSIVAELLALKNNWVKLKREDGKEITMPMSKLSVKDREWVKKNVP